MMMYTPYFTAKTESTEEDFCMSWPKCTHRLVSLPPPLWWLHCPAGGLSVPPWLPSTCTLSYHPFPPPWGHQAYTAPLSLHSPLSLNMFFKKIPLPHIPIKLAPHFLSPLYIANFYQELEVLTSYLSLLPHVLSCYYCVLNPVQSGFCLTPNNSCHGQWCAVLCQRQWWILRSHWTGSMTRCSFPLLLSWDTSSCSPGPGSSLCLHQPLPVRELTAPHAGTTRQYTRPLFFFACITP